LSKSPMRSGRNVQRSPKSRRVSLTDSVYDALRERIIFSEIPAGEILAEGRLAEEHGVSKTPVREALALLSQQGLIEVLPRVGYRVTNISVEDVHDVFRLRMLLESDAAALAAKRAPQDDVVAFREWTSNELDRLDQARSLSQKTYTQFHDAFHLGITILAESSRLTRFIRSLLSDSTRIRVRDPLMSVEGFEEDRELTADLTDALLARDDALAARLMRDHLTQSKERILAHLTDPERRSHRVPL